MNADEKATGLIGVYLRSSAASNALFHLLTVILAAPQ
jgi:hypothetical protein